MEVSGSLLVNSLTRTVPAGDPSLLHSAAPPLAVKNKVLPTAVRFPGAPDSPPARSLTTTVPSNVPSDFHRARAADASNCEKNNVPLTTVKWIGSPSGLALL